jgi:hypothetical protein
MPPCPSSRLRQGGIEDREVESGIKGESRLEDAKGKAKKLVHDGPNDFNFGLTRIEETLTKDLDDVVMLNGSESRHEKSFA